VYWGCPISAPGDILSKVVVVNANLADVWRAWTTEDGLRFISAESRVALEPGGAYEWFLDLEPDEQGLRGAEGSHLLAVLPEDLIVFNWTFPPSIPTLRASRAMNQVVVRFEALGPKQTRVRLDAGGWREGEDWHRGREYFDQAWSTVLTRLQESFDPKR